MHGQEEIHVVGRISYDPTYWPAVSVFEKAPRVSEPELGFRVCIYIKNAIN